MRKEAVSTQTLDYTTQSCTYKIVDTIQDVSSIMQSLTSMRTQQLALVITTLHFEHERKISLSKLAQIDQSVRYYLDNLRSLVRKTDVVCLLDRTFYFMLIGANLQGGSIVQERLWDALLWRVHNASDGEVLRPRSMTMGHSAYPTPYNNIHQCIAAASVARQSFDVQPEKSARQMSVSPSRDSDLSILARQLGIPYLSLLPRKLPTQIQQLISPRLAQELHCYPLGREHNTLTVAISDPGDRRALDRLHQETGLHIFPVLAPPQELQTALEQLV